MSRTGFSLSGFEFGLALNFSRTQKKAQAEACATKNRYDAVDMKTMNGH